MSTVTVSRVTTRKELKAFVRFNYELYKGSPYAVPDILEDTMEVLSPQSNPAFRFCDAALFLAKRDGRVVGRVAAIINHRANERWGRQEVRFGWIDFIDDPEVSRELLAAVSQFGREHGMSQVVGPLGFTDLDPEGMLTEGFDQLSTAHTIYNYPYYAEHMRQLGYTQQVEWVERKIFIPKGMHEANRAKYFRMAQIVQQRFGFQLYHFKSKAEIRQGHYVEQMLSIINASYDKLYGYSELDTQQMAWYARKFLPLLDCRFLTVVKNAEGELIGVGICLTSLSRAIQKAKGRLFPFGWWHLVKELWLTRRHQVIDALLIGVLPEYQEKGATAIIFSDMIPNAVRLGYDWAESHPQLNDNNPGQQMWKNLDCVIHKRRVVFSAPI